MTPKDALADYPEDRHEKPLDPLDPSFEEIDGRDFEMERLRVVGWTKTYEPSPATGGKRVTVRYSR